MCIYIIFIKTSHRAVKVSCSHLPHSSLGPRSGRVGLHVVAVAAIVKDALASAEAVATSASAFAAPAGGGAVDLVGDIRICKE